MKYLAICSVLAFTLIGCESSHKRGESAHTQWSNMHSMGTNITLSAFHQAAKMGAFDLYFDQMTDDAIFMGTDATERWTKEEFMNYAREPFSDGHGWTYEPFDRHTAFSDDLTTAWVDELLRHETYGTLRGTAVLEKRGERWLIAQYSLTFLVPNDIAGEVVETIRRFEENDDQ